MATFSKILLSGSTDGRPIKITATATPGTLIHTAHASAIDEIYLYAANWSATDIEMVTEFGGVMNPDDLIKTILRAGEGLTVVVPGAPLTDSLIVRAWASTGILNVVGFVNRIA